MFFLLLNLFSSDAMANHCSYHLEQTQIHVDDRTVQFGDFINQQLLLKGYSVVESGGTPTFLIEVTYRTYDSTHFQHALARVTMTELVSGNMIFKESDTRCYTQNCAVKDAAKVIKSSIQDFEKILPVCKED